MGSSKHSKTEEKEKKKKKSKDGEISKTAGKEREIKRKKEKEKEKKKKKEKKLKLSNGNLKDDEVLIVPSSSTESQQKQQQQQEDDTVMSNGRTSSTKPKKSKRKQQDDEPEDEEDAKTHAFPMNRIRAIIKGEDPDLRVSQEAMFAINKAAEKFLEQFTQDAYAFSVSDRKKSLGYKHLASVVSKQRRYDFLSDFVPEKVKAEDALRERNSGGNEGG